MFFFGGEIDFFISVSIGISIFFEDVGDGEMLFWYVDIVMYEVKVVGGNVICLYILLMN